MFETEYPLLRWLEANGYDVSYATGIDTDRRGAELLPVLGLLLRRRYGRSLRMASPYLRNAARS